MDVISPSYQLFPEIDPHESGFLDLDGHHKMYWEISGNPKGVPVVFLHGGPGAGSSPAHRRFFDPEYYRIIIFDQRGSGRSIPFAEIENNTTQHLVADMEKLRKHLKINKWLMLGGSWGSALALAYGIEYPLRISGFILRGVFLCRDRELDWFLKGIATIFPEAWRQFTHFLPFDERQDVLSSFHKRLTNKDSSIHSPAARAWASYEGACSTLLPNSRITAGSVSGRTALALARIEAHYFVNRMFLPDNYFFDHLEKIRNIPAIIIQGRYDMVCPITTADALHRSWPECKYHVISDAGHSAMEPSIRSALVASTEKFKTEL
jgi:proline iminopeptidase